MRDLAIRFDEQYGGIHETPHSAFVKWSAPFLIESWAPYFWSFTSAYLRSCQVRTPVFAS
jgi:hypothetical protein